MAQEAVSYPSCFVCGCRKTGAHPLFIRQSGQPGPYFPFLETHEPPEGAQLPTKCGKVLSCYACYAFLIQQWESYEKNKIPLIKRIYWLKRIDNGPYTGVEMGMQSEYASQVFGLTSDTPGQGQVEIKKPNSSFSKTDSGFENTLATSPHLPPDACFKDSMVSSGSSHSNSNNKKQDIQQEALDLSVEKHEKKRKYNAYSSIEVCHTKPSLDFRNAEVLDLSMPDKNAATEVCYICGNQFAKGTLSNIFAKNFDKYNPFFPSLMLHSRPSGSRPMEPSGKVSSCKECLAYLLSQWTSFENLKIPYNMRNYSFKKLLPGLENSKYVCYNCGKIKMPSSLQLVFCQSNSEGKPYYSQLLSLPPKPGALSITSNGEVHVCDNCCKGLEYERLTALNSSDSGTKYIKKEICLQKMHSSSSINVDSSLIVPKVHACGNNEFDLSFDNVSCCLCHQAYSMKQIQTLSMVPDSSNSNEMFFPFLKFLPQVSQNMVTEDRRILACKGCYSHLSSQWLEYEKDNIPANQRHFSLRALSVTSQSSPRLTPISNHTPPHTSSDHSSPPGTSTPPNASFTASSSENKEHARKTNSCKLVEGYHGQSLKELEVVTALSEESPVTLSVMTTQRALNVNINCYICGFHSKAGQTYSIKSKVNGKEMFFPFLNKHVSTHPEAAVDDVTYLVCLICFHSLVVQWQHYEKGRIEYHARFYDTYNFSCYICGTKTYRKRLYLTPVKDYPFLKEQHACPTGSMVVNNGHSVVVCKDCYISLNEQYTALERLGVPVEKRQYNWIQRPPPPEFNEAGPNNLKVNPTTPGGLPSTLQSVSTQRSNCLPTGREHHLPNNIMQGIKEENILEIDTNSLHLNNCTKQD